MILLNIPRWSLFPVCCIFFSCFIGFFLYIILVLCGKAFPNFLTVILPFWFHLFQIYACFINYNINAFKKISESFIITFVSLTFGWITKKNSFVCFGFELTKLFISPFNKTFYSKNSKVFYSRRLTIQKFIWSLISIYSNIRFVENNYGNKCYFTPEGCRSSRFI